MGTTSHRCKNTQSLANLALTLDRLFKKFHVTLSISALYRLSDSNLSPHTVRFPSDSGNNRHASESQGHIPLIITPDETGQTLLVAVTIPSLPERHELTLDSRAEGHSTRTTVNEKETWYLSAAPALPHHCSLLGDVHSKQTQT